MSAPAKKRRRTAPNKKRRRDDDKKENEAGSDKRHRDAICFFKETDTRINIKWAEAGCGERLKYAAMFDSSHVSDAITLSVWGAPFDLCVSKQLLRIEHTPLTEALDNNTLSISRYTILSICNHNEDIAHDFWMTVWNYIALLYGLSIDTVDSCRRWITVIRPGKLSLKQCVYLLSFTDFFCDSTTRTLVILSMNAVTWPKNWVNCFTENTKCDALTMLYRQALQLDPQNSNTIIQNLISMRIQKEIEPFVEDVIIFLKKMITHEEYFSEAWTVLFKYDCILYEHSALGEHAQLIDLLFTPLDANQWNILKRTTALIPDSMRKHVLVYNQYHCLPASDSLEYNEIICNSYDLALSRLQHYWSFIFRDAPQNLTDHLVFSGSVIPMCCLSFRTPAFKVAVSTLFAEADVDVYIVNCEQPQQLLHDIATFLHKTHDHVWKKSENSMELPDSNTVIKSVSYVLFGHPLFRNNHCLCVQFIYYTSSSDATATLSAGQIALNHHLCPVRAYFSPTEGIMIAPTALRSWITGNISFYRGFDSEPNPAIVFKYVQRRFGVIFQDDETRVYDLNSHRRLGSAIKKMLSALPEDVVETLKTNNRTHVPMFYDRLLSLCCGSDALDKVNEGEEPTSPEFLSLLDDKGVY